MNHYCPNCREELTQNVVEGNIILSCLNCKGVAVTPDIAGKMNPNLFNQLWNLANSDLGYEGKQCPFCSNHMKKIPLKTGKNWYAFSIELCKNSQILWFDRGELENFKKFPKNYKLNYSTDEIEELSKTRSVATGRESYWKSENKVRPFFYGLTGLLLGIVIYILFSDILSIYFYGGVGFSLGLIDGILDKSVGSMIRKSVYGLVLVPFFSILWGDIYFYKLEMITENILIGFSSGISYAYGNRLLSKFFDE